MLPRNKLCFHLYAVRGEELVRANLKTVSLRVFEQVHKREEIHGVKIHDIQRPQRNVLERLRPQLRNSAWATASLL